MEKMQKSGNKNRVGVLQGNNLAVDLEGGQYSFVKCPWNTFSVIVSL